MLTFSLLNLVFAEEGPKFEARSITAEPEGIVFKTDSQDEFEALVQEIEEGNARAKQMWETSTSGGVKHFTNVHDFLVKPHNNSTGVDNVYWEYEYLDSKRTVAVNTSFIVSILKNDGLYHNYDVTKYIEYYASGGVNGY
jgi:hypothetical protein